MRDPLAVFTSSPPVDVRRNVAVVDRSSGNGRAIPNAAPFRPRVIGRRMDEVEPCSIRWLWPDRIPQARLTVLAGDGGVGKSFLSLAIAATLSRGAAWPDQPGSESEPGTTILLSAEDCADDTIRPRLDAAQADCSKIHIVESVRRYEKGELEYFNLLDDLRALEEKIAGTQARLCIIDPIGAFLAGTDSHKDASVRNALGPLAGLSSRTGCAVLAIMHINKARSAIKVSDRVCGSVAFTNAARMAWLVGADPDHETRKLMLPYKCNIIERPSGLAFEIVDGAVRWFPEAISLDAELVLASANENRSERSEVADWLAGILAVGPLSVVEIRKAAEADCHAWRTIERSKKSLGIRSRREGFGKTGRFMWELPDVAAYDAIDRQPESGGQCDNRSETAVLPIDRHVCATGGLWANDPNETPLADRS